LSEVRVLLRSYPESERLNGRGPVVARSTIRVLVVDDYEPWRHSMLSMLRELPGFEVVSEVSDGPEAVRKVQEFEVDLILLDIGLPTLNGIAAAREIRKLSPHSKILFVSQESSPDVVREALKTGEGYLVKADAGRELRAALNAVLRGKRFVGSRFVGQGFPDASDGLTKRVGNKNVFASLEQTKRVGHRHKVMFYSEHRHFLDDLAQFALLKPAMQLSW
jgi:DNA-binding response OmpR family regulator